jgi:hypothetical protein
LWHLLKRQVKCQYFFLFRAPNLGFFIGEIHIS